MLAPIGTCGSASHQSTRTTVRLPATNGMVAPVGGLRVSVPPTLDTSTAPPGTPCSTLIAAGCSAAPVTTTRSVRSARQPAALLAVIVNSTIAGIEGAVNCTLPLGSSALSAAMPASASICAAKPVPRSAIASVFKVRQRSKNTRPASRCALTLSQLRAGTPNGSTATSTTFGAPAWYCAAGGNAG